MTHTNTVANHVIATCLRDTSMTPQEGPRLWRIQEAEECRGLGNFSSLHTILSALQSPAINHLRDLETSFQEVTSVLETAERARQGAQERQRQQGVVPSLVTFFSSLELLDATMEDYVEVLSAVTPASCGSRGIRPNTVMSDAGSAWFGQPPGCWAGEELQCCLPAPVSMPVLGHNNGHHQCLSLETSHLSQRHTQSLPGTKSYHLIASIAVAMKVAVPWLQILHEEILHEALALHSLLAGFTEQAS
ncbi:uncharacterized protein [Equus przewalskii]|uniref:Uncharacterized protein isoform X3 n=1 Tax=Equus przewalskii TaxID=9798 RepID=A0ABM4M8Y2_EQUPR